MQLSDRGLPVCRQEQRGVGRSGGSVGTLLDAEGLVTRGQLGLGGRRLTVAAPLRHPAGGPSRGGGHGFEGSDVLHLREISLLTNKIKQV